MSAVAMVEAPCTSMVFSRKPAAPKRPSIPVPMALTWRSPRWPVARVAVSAIARSITEPIRATLGDRPWCSPAGAPRARVGAAREAAPLEVAPLEVAWGGVLLEGFALGLVPPRTAAGIRVLHNPKHQPVEIHALLRRLLGDE